MWLFKAPVRPHLEYCTVTYPVYEKDAKLLLLMLESVQRRATKMVPEMKNCDYATRLQKLALPSLSYRRKRGDMIEVYKYTHGLYTVSAMPVEVEEKTTRGNNYKLNKKRSSTTRRLTFFSMRVVNAWNSLPVNAVSDKGALYRIQILCRRYTFWSYPAGLTIADPPGCVFFFFSGYALRPSTIPFCGLGSRVNVNVLGSVNSNHNHNPKHIYNPNPNPTLTLILTLTLNLP